MVALEQVQRDYGALLGRVASSYAASAADRADLLQEIALSLVKALPRFRGDSSLRTYVLRIAHNCAVRRISRRRGAALPLDEAEHASQQASPEEQVAARREVAQLTAAVRRLPLGLRQVLTLTLEGLSQREIGEVLGLTENAVSVRLHRARTQLADELGEPSAQRKGPRHG
ncbi:MAG: sigma-70 family RNA polymerase sigma factor [Polyangiales bacterium]